MNRLKLPIIIVAVVAALGAGLYASGIIGGGSSGPVKKHHVPPIPLAEPQFVVNLKDANGAMLRLGLAVQLEPLSEERWAAYSGANAGGHGGGGDVAPGVMMVSTYPKFRDAVIRVASTYSSDDLLTEAGKKAFKTDLLREFAANAETDAAEIKSSAPEDPNHFGPPYDVIDVQFTDFVVQLQQ